MKNRLYLLFFFLTSYGFSQGPPPPGLPDDPTVLPINQLQPVLLAAGILLGLYVCSKKR